MEQATLDVALVTNHSTGKGMAQKIAHEDIRLAPQSSLLKELDEIELSTAVESGEKNDKCRAQ